MLSYFLVASLHAFRGPCGEDTVYAVVKTGGKQYKAQVGQVLTVEKLDTPAGEEVQFDEVLMVSGDAGTTVGAPLVEGASVTGREVRLCSGLSM